MVDQKRVLATGMAGQTGGVIRGQLRDRYVLSGLDKVALDDRPTTVADISDYAARRLPSTVWTLWYIWAPTPALAAPGSPYWRTT